VSSPPSDLPARGRLRRLLRIRPPRPGGVRRWRPGLLGLLAVAVGAFTAALLFFQGVFGDLRFTSEEPEQVPVDASPPLGTARIMILGDSIAQGSTGDHTWRYRLWRHLTEDAGLDVRFVGPEEDLFPFTPGPAGADAYADPDFDRAHAAVWGATAEQLVEDVAADVAEYDPHYLLVMAGLNDLMAGVAPEVVQGHVSDIVAAARVGRGDVQVVLGEVTPVWGTGRDEAFNEDVIAFNAGLPELAAQLTGEDSPVVVAAAAEDYAPADDNWDPVHPNSRGELKIAAAFADALAEGLNLGEPYPRPLPEPPVGPRVAPEVHAERAEDDARAVELSWDPVPGATRYQVWQRRTAPDADEFTAIPAEVQGAGQATRTALAEQLLLGADYAFYVEPIKGEDAGEASDPVEITLEGDEPAAPKEVAVNPEGTTLVWSEVSQATHYAVWRRALDCEQDPDTGDGEGCRPVDEHGPDEGEGWESVAAVEEGRSWELDPAGGGGFEFVVRAHSDYLSGEDSEPVIVKP
jgi:hypothetical protein